jgi:DNA-3-methyladenine glycosylase I
MRDAGEDFGRWLWGFVEGKPVIHHYKTLAEIPTKDAVSEAVSKELRQRGFTFVGPVIVYAFMQAAGLYNDHLVSCFRHGELGG